MVGPRSHVVYLHDANRTKSYSAWAAAIAPWYRLRLPSCGRGFEPQAHHLPFFSLYYCNSNEKRTKINKIEAAIGPWWRTFYSKSFKYSAKNCSVDDVDVRSLAACKIIEVIKSMLLKCESMLGLALKWLDSHSVTLECLRLLQTCLSIFYYKFFVQKRILSWRR